MTKKCNGVHCRCMEKDCSKIHYADCAVHNKTLGKTKPVKCVACNGTGEYTKPNYDSIEGEVKRLVAGGVSYRDIMRIMGWKSPNTVQYYAHKN